MCGCVGVYLYVCTRKDQRSTSSVIPQLWYTLVWDRLGWLVIKPQGLGCLCLLLMVSVSMHHHVLSEDLVYCGGDGMIEHFTSHQVSEEAEDE